MSDLLSAYVALGLPEGTPLLNCLRRYRWLATAFHPDRFVDGRKAVAETEMKKINAAREYLQKHFRESGHKPTDICLCSRGGARAAAEESPVNAGHGSAGSPSNWTDRDAGAQMDEAVGKGNGAGAARAAGAAEMAPQGGCTEYDTGAFTAMLAKHFYAAVSWLCNVLVALASRLQCQALKVLDALRKLLEGLPEKLAASRDAFLAWLKANPADAAPWVMVVLLLIIGAAIKAFQVVFS